jgi:hypothetical protein
MLMLMMKGLLLLNVNNTVLHFCLSKRRSTRVKNLTIDRVWVKKEVKQSEHILPNKGSDESTVVLPKMESKRRLTRRSKRVKDLRELLMLTENP